MNWPRVLVAFFVIVNSVHSLYEDQIGKFDWRHQYVGRVSHSFFDLTGKKIVVATEENVLAVLHAGTGKIEWRHVLGGGPKSKIHHIFNVDGRIATVSGTPTTLRVVDASTGILQWEVTLDRDTQSITTSYTASTKEVTVVEVLPSKSGYELAVNQYSLSNGAENTLPTADLPWFNPAMRCQLVYPHLVCLDDEVLNIVDIKDPLKHQRISLTELSLNSVNQIGSAKSFFWLKTADQFHIFTVTNDGVQLVTRSPTGTILVDIPTTKDSGEQYFCFVVANGPEYLIRILDIESKQLLDNVGGSLKLSQENGRPEVLSTYLMRKAGGELSYRFAITTSDDALLYGSKKDVYWSREESLTSIIQVEMVDLPVSETDASIEEEFGPEVTGIFGHTVKRVASQLRQLLIFIRHVLAGEGLRPYGDGVSSSKSLVRDRFGLHKLILIVTRPGKMFAMDSISGKIVWQRLLDIDTDKLRLYVQRTSVHYPMEPQCTILAKSSSNPQESVLYVFHPITGQGDFVRLGYGVQQAMLLPQSAETEYMKPLLLLDHLNQPHIHPSSGINQLVNMAGQLFLFTADSKSCIIKGYSLAKSTAQHLSATPVWQLQLCSPTESADEQIVSIVGGHTDEKVHSQGRVLADRSVLYKYLNPNLVAVTTAGSNHPQHKGYLNIYLIDVVSGSVVFSASHRRVQPPYHLVMAENWVVYSYYNEKYRRTELGSLELLEGPTRQNETAFSSFTAPQPLVDRQAYIYPAHITAMKDTFSEQGMTAKHILLGLSNGWIQELPRVFLDPRRPVVAQATPEMREESIMPYLPELPIPAEAIINYNQTVYNVRNIYVTHSSLESTGLVFAHGLDIFFTHVTPSKTFDVLNDDFEYFFIALVLTGLTVASFITKRLASKKALRQAWK